MNAYPKKTTTVDITKMAKEAKQYVASSEGVKTIKEALDLTQERISRLNEARRVDPKSLHEPITL